MTVRSTGEVALKIACPATTVTCAGKVSLKGATGRRTSLGAKAFTLAGGKTATVTPRLSAANRRLLRRLHTLRMTVTPPGRDRIAFPAATRTIRLTRRR